jgi:hypothetical protein
MWDLCELAEFFLFDSVSLELGDPEERGVLYRADDGLLRAEMLATCARFVTFTLSTPDGVIVADLGVIPLSRLELRLIDQVESLYCHECVVAPGFHSYQRIDQWAYIAEHQARNAPVVSLAFTCRPRITLRLFDTSPDGRTIKLRP